MKIGCYPLDHFPSLFNLHDFSRFVCGAQLREYDECQNPWQQKKNDKILHCNASNGAHTDRTCTNVEFINRKLTDVAKQRGVMSLTPTKSPPGRIEWNGMEFIRFAARDHLKFDQLSILPSMSSAGVLGLPTTARSYLHFTSLPLLPKNRVMKLGLLVV